MTSIYRTAAEVPDFNGRETRRWWRPGMRTGYTSPDLFNVAAWWFRRKGKEVVWINDGDAHWDCIEVYRRGGLYSHGAEIHASRLFPALFWYVLPWLMAKLRGEPYEPLRGMLHQYLNRYVPRPWIGRRLRGWLMRRLDYWTRPATAPSSGTKGGQP